LNNCWGFECTCMECNLQGDKLKENEARREEVKEIQSVGIENLSINELEHLLKLCKDVGVKPYYELCIIEELLEKSFDRVERYYQVVRGLSVAIHSYGVDSTVAQEWKQKLEFDDFDVLQF